MFHAISKMGWSDTRYLAAIFTDGPFILDFGKRAQPLGRGRAKMK